MWALIMSLETYQKGREGHFWDYNFLFLNFWYMLEPGEHFLFVVMESSKMCIILSLLVILE